MAKTTLTAYGPALLALLASAALTACAPLPSRAPVLAPHADQPTPIPPREGAAHATTPSPSIDAMGPPEAPVGPPQLLARTREADVVERALALLGVRYRYGGQTPSTGFDCSGFVRFVLAIAPDVALPRSALAMSRMAAPSVQREDLRVADLLFFRIGRRVSHVGLYLGGGRFVHAPSRGGHVRIDALHDAYWRARYAGAKRVLNAG